MVSERNDLRYDYAGNSRLFEGADWFGARAAGLQTHYHDEVQVSAIWHGYRQYVIGGEIITLRPFQILVLGGRVSHRALPSRDRQLRSLELYLDPSVLLPHLRASLATSSHLLLERAGSSEFVEIATDNAAIDLTDNIVDLLTEKDPGVDQPQPSRRPLSPVESAVVATRQVAEAAEEFGYSTEGFIRAFARQVGLTPHAYKVNHRLNEGRQMLRAGASIAEVANTTGFSDQSHFGRAFLAHFGATPGHFLAAHRGR